VQITCKVARFRIDRGPRDELFFGDGNEEAALTLVGNERLEGSMELLGCC
jgi:hypothetical protein